MFDGWLLSFNQRNPFRKGCTSKQSRIHVFFFLIAIWISIYDIVFDRSYLFYCHYLLVILMLCSKTYYWIISGGFPTSYALVFLCSVRGVSSFCWYRWNCWSSLFKLTSCYTKIPLHIVVFFNIFALFGYLYRNAFFLFFLF